MQFCLHKTAQNNYNNYIKEYNAQKKMWYNGYAA